MFFFIVYLLNNFELEGVKSNASDLFLQRFKNAGHTFHLLKNPSNWMSEFLNFEHFIHFIMLWCFNYQLNQTKITKLQVMPYSWIFLTFEGQWLCDTYCWITEMRSLVLFTHFFSLSGYMCYIILVKFGEHSAEVLLQTSGSNYFSSQKSITCNHKIYVYCEYFFYLLGKF